MIRRFNRTGRKTIAHQHARVTLHRLDAEQTSFEIALDLTPYDFPKDANIRVEAWRSNAIQRWEFGTVGEIARPPPSERVLRDVPESAAFRVAVVAPDDSGLLFGLSANIRPRRQPSPGKERVAESLLPVERVRDLGEEVWRLDFGDEELPVLQLNASIADISYIVNDPAFRSLVVPEIFRSILQRAILVSRVDPDDPDANAWSDWIALAKTHNPGADIPAVKDPAADDERERAFDWIEEAVAGFAAQKGLDAAATYRKVVEAAS